MEVLFSLWSKRKKAVQTSMDPVATRLELEMAVVHGTGFGWHERCIASGQRLNARLACGHFPVPWALYWSHMVYAGSLPKDFWGSDAAFPTNGRPISPGVTAQTALRFYNHHPVATLCSQTFIHTPQCPDSPCLLLFFLCLLPISPPNRDLEERNWINWSSLRMKQKQCNSASAGKKDA